MARALDIAAEFGAHTSRLDRFSIYIPNEDRDGAPVEQEKWIDEALALLSDINGGATAMPPIRGAWLNPQTRQLICEEPVIVYSFIEPAQFERRLSEVVALVHKVGKQTNQGEMAIEFNGELFLIKM